ncbi:MOSC N-terminal beta barrel domain-containing protein [Goekera deserti]|uniref:MOSC N-terminal beta barrel domain-containing protein n=1 Tax=Goekera deserti TaxID=2497753 RepID=UPI001F1C9A1E|nr:MOSC N-terminal beta barrel domain-containing protein [Goekera deserti]
MARSTSPPPVPRPAGPRQPGRAVRLEQAVARDGATCVWCGRAFGPAVPPTTEHVVPRVKGGPSWAENEVAACPRCNGERGHRGPVDWLEECERRGWCPDETRVAAALDALAEAIGRRGGQRRARPYLEAQRTRLGRRPARQGGGPRSVRAVERDSGTGGAGRVVGTVGSVWVHPVKSLAGRSVPEVDVGPAGLAGDRLYAVVDAATGERLRAKAAPQLAGLTAVGDPAADGDTIGRALGRAVRLERAAAPQVDVAAVHLVSRQARGRADAGEVPDGCSAEDPRANLVLELPDDDERGWVGREVRVGDCVLIVTRTPKHCLGVYAEVRTPGRVRVGDAVLLVG